MTQSLQFRYYYGEQAEQFHFYQIPKVLFTDARFKNVFAEAKILYGLMLDRMSLSRKNNWVDKENRIYIYFTLEDALELLGCGRRIQTLYLKQRRRLPKIRTLKKKEKSRLPILRSLQICKSEVKTSQKRMLIMLISTRQSIAIQSYLIHQKMRWMRWSERAMVGDKIRENIEYNILLMRNPSRTKEIAEMVELMTEVVRSKRSSIRLDKQEIPQKIVKDRFLSLQCEHIEYVLESMKNSSSMIHNILASLLIPILSEKPVLSTIYFLIFEKQFRFTPLFSPISEGVI